VLLCSSSISAPTSGERSRRLQLLGYGTTMTPKYCVVDIGAIVGAGDTGRDGQEGVRHGTVIFLLVLLLTIVVNILMISCKDIFFEIEIIFLLK
jgi:hypothetical protein